jgi:glycosyltransferase involved in cell wall biosynthesis
MRPLNIFVVHPSKVITDYLPSGAGWIAYNYLKGLADRGHVIHAAVPRVEMRGPVPRGLHLHEIPEGQRTGLFNRLSYIRAVRRLYVQLSDSLQFDIAQQLTPVDTGLSFAMLGTGVPLVLGPYSGYWPDANPNRLKRWARDGLAGLQQQQASALIVTCPAALERIASRRARETKVHVIAHGIDTAAYRERERIPSQASILFLALLEYRKGIFILLNAFDRVAAVDLDCTLEIWGEGAEAAAVERRVSQSPFRDRIHFKGRAPRDQVSRIMQSHSVYCLPSFGEPFGMTLLEAMASGVPIVTTAVGGPPHIVREAGGRIIPMRNVERLADALLEVLSSTDLQRSMGAYNRKRAEQEFDWSKSLDRMENVYRQVLSKQPLTSPAV